MITVKDSVLEQEIEDRKTAEYEKWKQEVLFRAPAPTARTPLPSFSFRTVVHPDPAVAHTHNEILEGIMPSLTAEDAIADRAKKEPNLTCFIDQFPLAMAAISRVHDYERGPLVKGDYTPSLLRHLFGIGEHPDHDAAVAWNAIARLELRERNKESTS